ncbi:EAL domain-containing protein [Hoyosella sp. YIM 151337]|uniref:DICT sensory domain-containing protein n=1 Tax=Hoyosella sp. YIM 151337 TaxID=2992742 RepID=UPI0022364D04|nr:DICT sensory domain-containing protein [Hoyosella sp. YIM 151337]MCW4356027.1 EAL domain-containing protein [Hoyosella sp. YIM 151337]
MQETQSLDAVKLAIAPQSAPMPVLVSVDLESPTVPGISESVLHVITITHHAFAEQPAYALRAAIEARDAGRLIALDSVGSAPQSIALLPLIEPDIVIFSPELIARRADADVSRTVHSVASCAERHGTVLIADGVDSELHRRRALATGATHGMGKLYEPATSLAEITTEHVAPLPIPPAAPTRAVGETPFTIVSGLRAPVRSAKRLLIEMSIGLETLASGLGRDAICVGTFQYAENFTERTAARWRNLARHVTYAGVYGVGMSLTAIDGVHHAPLDTSDPLTSEWNVIVLSPHFSCVLSALDLRRGTADQDREFDYVVSYDSDVVKRSARAVLRHFE